MTTEPLKPLVLERLMRYYLLLSESTAKEPIKTITSARIGAALGIDATQVRKDLGAVGLMGIGRVGFDVCEICRTVRAVLGFDQIHEAVLIGSGHLGGALIAYSGFVTYGLEIAAAFDNNPARIGTSIEGLPIRPMSELEGFVKERTISLAIITTPAEVSQSVADLLVAMGIEAIWNFSPRRLVVPEETIVCNAHISLGLSNITYHLGRR